MLHICKDGGKSRDALNFSFNGNCNTNPLGGRPPPPPGAQNPNKVRNT